MIACRRLKRENAKYFIGLNGGIESLSYALEEINVGDGQLDGVMLGRSAYQSPRAAQTG